MRIRHKLVLEVLSHFFDSSITEFTQANIQTILTWLRGGALVITSQPLSSLFILGGGSARIQRRYYSLVPMCLQFLWVRQERQTREQMVIVTDLFQSSLCQQSWRVTRWSRWLVVSPSLSPGACPRSGEKNGNTQTGIQQLFHEIAKKWLLNIFISLLKYFSQLNTVDFLT